MGEAFYGRLYFHRKKYLKEGRLYRNLDVVKETGHDASARNNSDRSRRLNKLKQNMGNW